MPEQRTLTSGGAEEGRSATGARFASEHKPMTRILVVDDHAVVRAGIRQFLADTPDIEVSAEAASALEAIHLVRERPFDLMLLDISMPDKSGVDVLKQIKRERPDLPVLVLSMHPENRYAVQLLRHGASGYMQKEAMPNELVDAIRLIARGRKYISSAVAELLAGELDQSVDKPLHETLSEREFQIFMQLARGQTVSAIAKAANLSVKTVSTYRARVLDKMKIANNAELTYYAIKNGLVD